MDTPGRISSHASSSLPSQSDHKLEDEGCEDETDDNVPSYMHEMRDLASFRVRLAAGLLADCSSISIDLASFRVRLAAGLLVDCSSISLRVFLAAGLLANCSSVLTIDFVSFPVLLAADLTASPSKNSFEFIAFRLRIFMTGCCFALLLPLPDFDAIITNHMHT